MSELSNQNLSIDLTVSEWLLVVSTLKDRRTYIGQILQDSEPDDLKYVREFGELVGVLTKLRDSEYVRMGED